LYKEEAEELLERKVGRASPLGCRRSYKVDSSALLPFLALSVEICHLNVNSLLFLVSSEMAAGLISSFYCKTLVFPFESLLSLAPYYTLATEQSPLNAIMKRKTSHWKKVECL